MEKKEGELKEKNQLEEIYKVYKKYFHIEDTKRIDIVLATALSQKLEGIPIWLFIVGASGDMKSVQLNSLSGKNVFILHNLTSKTLVNGYKDKNTFPDLAPELDNKIVVITDMAQILKLPPDEKGELWAQMRDLYDGLAGKISGQGSRAKYENLKITLIAGSTPAIDSQILIHQDLGTRELIYRTSGNKQKKKVMKQCFDNEEFEKKISTELKESTSIFLEQTNIKRKNISTKIYDTLMEIALYITFMRASAEFDNYTNELRNEVYPEEPTRIAKQLKRLYICLTSLSKDYPEERAIAILWHIAKSSAFPLRIKIFEYLLKNHDKELSTSSISNFLHIGKSTVKRETNILWNLNILICRKEPISTNQDFTYDYWKINQENTFIKELQKINLKRLSKRLKKNQDKQKRKIIKI
jgi:predicted transcriptional regulator